MIRFAKHPVGYRLTAADYSNGDYYHYTYDAVGNRLAQTSMVNGLSSTVDYVYDDANRLTSVNGVNYTWDNNGNLLNDGVNAYTYNAANQLKTLTGPSVNASYGYNGMGDRLQEVHNGGTTNFMMDYNTGLTQVLNDGTNNYIYGNGRIAQVNTGTDYFLGDALGSVRQLTNNSGVVTYASAYDPYGVTTQTYGAAQTAYGFTGEYTSQGLVYLRARMYSSGMGRFLTRDTWQGDANRPMSFNRWNYGYGNPVKYTDPSGMCVNSDGSVDFWKWPWGSRQPCPSNTTSVGFTQKITSAYQDAMRRWEEARANQCSMMLTGCPSYSISPMDAVKQTAELQALNCWGGITAEQLQQLDQTLDIVQRVAAINNLLRSSTDRVDFSNIEGTDPSQVDQMVPLDWSVEHDPFYDRQDNFIDQWVYTSPNGQEQLRLHQPIPAYGGTTWQARWGNRVDKSVYDYLGRSWVQEFRNENGQIEYWIYFDDHGNIIPLVSDEGHIPIKDW